MKIYYQGIFKQGFHSSRLLRTKGFRHSSCLKTLVNQNGFSLMEVMFALALIGISLATLLASQSQGLSLANEAKFNTTAAFLAQGKMAELEMEDINSLMSDSGNFDEELFPEYYWEVEIDKTSNPLLEDYADNFKQIDLHVYFGEKRIYQYDLRLYKYKAK